MLMKEIEWRRIRELKDQLVESGNSSRAFPQEIIDLYGPWAKKTVFLEDFRPDGHDRGINENQIEAEARILHAVALAERKNTQSIILLCGPMSSGKTTVGSLLQEDLSGSTRRLAVYRHHLDRERFAHEMQSHGGKRLVSSDFQNLENINIVGLSMVFVDEIQFAQENRRSIVAFLDRCARNRTHIVFSGLDMDFRRDAWPITELLMSRADTIIVLRARCAKCGNPAEFTQRLVNGLPAKVDDPLIVIGEVAHDDYQARCGRCHRVKGQDLTKYF